MDLTPVEPNQIKSIATELPTVDSDKSTVTEHKPPSSILLRITAPEPNSVPAEPAESKPLKSKPPKSEVPIGDPAKNKSAKDEPASSETLTKKSSKRVFEKLERGMKLC